MRVRGFAELTFQNSARLAFARACERLSQDVAVDHPDAWVVDDRRISFALDTEMSGAELQVHQRILDDLAKDATAGEVFLDADGMPRWTTLVGRASSGVPSARSSETLALDVSDTDVTAVRNGGKRS